MTVIPSKTPPTPLSFSAVSARPQCDAGTSSEMWSFHPPEGMVLTTEEVIRQLIESLCIIMDGGSSWTLFPTA